MEQVSISYNALEESGHRTKKDQQYSQYWTKLIGLVVI